ncbi:hypothetical protein V5O48_014311 [Marasmius crinis-equi]|uniref:Uncharacterized protein n=1 Tax=Marasmius crinis-equi TaxID=585013 RepID=A0ABR3EXM1_9AGAR
MPKYRFTFGKHRGKLVSEVPSDYITWCINKGLASKNPDLKRAIEASSFSNSSDPDLLSLKQRCARVEEIVPQWLYDVCWGIVQKRDLGTAISYTQEVETENTVQMEWLIKPGHDGKVFCEKYPPRPLTAEVEAFWAKKGECEAVRKLAGIVENYPEYDWRKRGTGEQDPRLVEKENAFAEEEWAEITTEFKNKIETCLNNVERELGPKAGDVAKWMVRDQHAARVKGVVWRGGGRHNNEYFFWEDESIDLWLK